MTFTEERAGHGGLVAMAVQLERRCVGDDSRAAWQLAQCVREGAAALLPALTTLQADFDRLSVLDSDSVSAGDDFVRRPRRRLFGNVDVGARGGVHRWSRMLTAPWCHPSTGRNRIARSRMRSHRSQLAWLAVGS